MDILLLEPKINIREIEYPYTLVSVFDAYPRVMRGYSPIGLNQLSKNGSNLSSVLYYLAQNQSEILQKILEEIKQLPEEDIESFDFITTSDNSDVLVALKYTNGQVISAKLLSDGTLRALAILTALKTVPEGSRIIIEEIDNGIHALRVNVLLNAIWEASNRRNLHTLITTHNPATLDDLSEEQLDGVVVCHYDKASQSAKLTPFFEIPNVDVLMQKGKLGGLVTRNVIERYLDPDFEKEQEAIALKWLESCE
jgi:predicted ATPase